MTGYDIYKRVCALLGYSNLPDSHTDRRTERMNDIINQIASDLKVSTVDSLSEEIKTDSKKTEALIYGCAMMLAVTESDGGHARLFAGLYNAKRSLALSNTESRVDIMPAPLDGGM